MATFLELTDTPSQYDLGNSQVVITAGGQLDFVTFSTNELVDVNTFGAYAPTNGQALVYFGGVQEWRPADVDPYSAGNGLNKVNGTLNVTVTGDGGLGANAQGIFLENVGTAGTYGNATHVPVITVNSKGQITSTTLVEGTFEVASSLSANHVRDIAGTAGQITVTGGSGVAANAVIGLVATGVTAGTYGNATYSPIITVDTYGRIQNVDLVQNVGGGSGNGNVDLSTVTTEAFKSIAVAGQTTVSADTKDDTLTFVAGAGMTITTTAGTDTITFESSGGSGGASVTVSDTAPVGPSAGDLWWDSSTGKLKIYYDDLTSAQWVDASPASGSTADYSEGALILPVNTIHPTDEGSISWDATNDTLYIGTGSSVKVFDIDYGNSDVQAYLDAQGYSNVDADAQTLSWDSANANLSISNGNTVNLNSLLDDTFVTTADFNTLNGVLTLTLSDSSTVAADLDGRYVQVGGTYGDSDVLALGEGNWAGNIIPSANVTYNLGSDTARWNDLFLSNATIYLGTDTISASGAGLLFNGNAIVSYTDASVQAYLDGQGYSNVAYGDAEVQSYLDAQGYSNVDLDAQTLIWDNANANLSISAGNTITLFDQSLDSTDTVTFNQVNTEDITGANQLILSAGASGITASTNGNMQFNATSGSIFLVTPTVDAQESAFLANTITANSLTVNGQTITAYGNTEVQTYLDAQGYSNVDLDAQTLTWDSANSNLSISGGNTVTLTGVGGGGLNNVVEDTTPQLGGNLDINSQFITGALIPDTNNTYDLGTAELKWRDLYLNSGSIYLGNVVLSTVANVLQANVEGTLKNVSFGGDPVVTSSVKPEPTNTEAVNGTDTFISGGDALGTNSIGGVLNLEGGSGAIGDGFINIGGANTSQIYMGTASIPSTITGSTVTITADTRLRRVKEVLSSLTNATGVVTHNCSNGHIFDHTSITSDFTVNLTNLSLPVGHATTISLVLHQGATAFIPTAVQLSGAAQTLLWQGGSPPTGTNNGTDVVSLSILNVGGSYTFLGQLVGFS